MRNISSYYQNGLCISCGICAGNCPKKCIEMVQSGNFVEPKVNNSSCIECGKCLSVCPNTEIGRVPEKETGLEEYLLGEFSAVYCAKSIDKDWLKKCGSGGAVSSLVIALLNSGEYDSAFCISGYDYRSKNIKTERYTAESDFLMVPRSRYLTVDHEYAVSYMLSHRNEKIIFVATPCAITGLRNTINGNHLQRDHYLLLGLFCDKTMHYGVVDYFKNYPADGRRMSDFYFRTKEVGGWPGGVRICYDDGSYQDLPNTERTKVKDFFLPERCLYCLDKLNRHADISFGDNYISGNKDNEGQSSVIIRTELGEGIWKNNSHLFEFHKDLPYDLIKSTALGQKAKNYYFGSLKGLHQIRESVPEIYRQQYEDALEKIAVGKSDDVYSSVNKALAVQKTESKPSFLKRVVNYLRRQKERKPEKGCKTFLITGANFKNKGAQAMLFTAVSELRARFPNCRILFNTWESNIPEDFKFDVVHISPNELSILDKNPLYYYFRLILVMLIRRRKDLARYYELRRMFKSVSAVIDISGYEFGSNWGYKRSLNYLHVMNTAKKYNIPVFLMPQSFGPFEYKDHQTEMDENISGTFPIAVKIFARENSSCEVFKKKYHLSNVEKSYDLVLQSKDIQWENISAASAITHDIQLNTSKNVAIIPNMRNLDQGGASNERIIELYKKIISELVQSGFEVYLVRHSEEDIEECVNIYYSLQDKTHVRLYVEDYNCVEFNELVKQFCFIIGSRYHSIIHSYKNSVPAIVLGWSEKYREVTSMFEQTKFMFDVRNMEEETILNAVKTMEATYPEESECIAGLLPLFQQANCFDSISDYFKGK